MATTLGAVAVGTSVYMNVGGVRTEFLVVHQGLPSSLYDSSCDGTWLLMKDLYEKRTWDGTNNDYANSDIHTYLNGTFLNLFDADIKAQIKQVKLPYHKGTGSGGSVSSGANGLSTKVFLLSCYELGWTTSNEQNFPVDGAKLSYFESGTGTSANDKRIANYSGKATTWCPRSANLAGTDYIWFISTKGSYSGLGYRSNTYGIRPALVMPSDMGVDDSGNVVMLSYEYTWLEWIKSSGTQYVDTGFVANNNTRVTLDIEYTKTVAKEQAAFGGRIAYGNSMYVLWLHTSAAGWQHGNGATLNYPVGSAVSGRVYIDKDKNVLKVNGTTVDTITATSFNSTYPLYLLTVNNGGSAMIGSYPTYAKIFSCQIYDNGTLVRDYIPAKRSDGTVGLYDKINERFYTNSGSGTFTAGPEIKESASQSLVGVGGLNLLIAAVNANVNGIEYQIAYALANVDGIEVVIPLAAGESGPTIITFNWADLKTYEAEEGMTWLEWVNSEYNVDGWYFAYASGAKKNILYTDNNVVVNNSNSEMQYEDTVIVDGERYKGGM